MSPPNVAAAAPGCVPPRREPRQVEQRCCPRRTRGTRAGGGVLHDGACRPRGSGDVDDPALRRLGQRPGQRDFGSEVAPVASRPGRSATVPQAEEALAANNTGHAKI